MTDWRPYSKEQQLARGERRYRRRVASAKQWQAIFNAKRGPCRVCTDPVGNGHATPSLLHLHHVVPRDLGGDDVPENLVPVCFVCHQLVTSRDRGACLLLVVSLRDDEYAYAVEKAGEDVWERVYGVEYQR